MSRILHPPGPVSRSNTVQQLVTIETSFPFTNRIVKDAELAALDGV
jgi:hypothetical protein